MGWCGIRLPSIGPQPKATIDIGVDTSDDASFDIAVRDGAALAIKQVRSVRGYPLRLVPYDDSQMGAYSADQGAQNMQLMVADRKMLGMVGPLRGPVAKSELPIANQAMLAMVSPTVSEPCLTLPLNRCSLFNSSYMQPAELRPTGKNNYFHLAATDQLHGTAMAEFAFHALGLRRVAVIDAATPTFEGDTFVAAFTQLGGTVVARQGFDFPISAANIIGPPDFRPWLRDAKAAGAQGLYVGGLTFSPIDELAPRMQSEGIFDPSSPYLGIDGLPDLYRYGIVDEPETDTGPMIDDQVYASRAIGSPYLNPKAASAVAAFVKLHRDPSENNSQAFAGYDAADILIAAIGRAIDANGGRIPSRRQVVDQLARTRNFQGLTGTYSFSAVGDPTTSTLQIEQYRTGAWAPVTNIAVASQ